MEINFRPIGVVKTQASKDQVRAKGDVEGELEIYPEFADGLDGIDGYSHLFVLVYFDRLRPEQIGPLKVKPRGSLRCGFKLEELPELGVFALDSPTRPNPIRLTLARLLRRDGIRWLGKGLDFCDGPSVLDSKGYRDPYRIKRFTVPEWFDKMPDDKGYI